MVIFEENYGWFVMLSILRYPNFISPLHLIKGLLRKPRLHLTANFCLASLNRLLRKNQRYTCFLILMGNGEPLGRGNFFSIGNRQPAVSKVVIESSEFSNLLIA